MLAGNSNSIKYGTDKELLNIINRRLRPFAPNCELTFEANPGDLPKEKLNVLLEGGVNRISFGVQTFRDNCLRKLDVSIREEDAFVAIRSARSRL